MPRDEMSNSSASPERVASGDLSESDHIREREAFMKALIDNMPFEFWARDLQERCTLQSAAIVRHWGDILGKRPEDSALSPSDLAEWKANNQRAFAGETVNSEVEYIVDGKKRCFHQIVAPFYVDREIRGILGFNIDISNRKQAEEALKRQMEFSEQIIRAANVVIVALDTSGVVRVFGGIAEELTGFASAEVIGRNWFDTLVPASVRDEVVSEFHRLRRGAQRDVFENPIQTKSGELKLISWKNSRMEEDGQVLGTISYGIDVTEQRQAERALREREEILRYIVKYDPSAIAVFDRELRYIAVSDRYLVDYNVKETDLLGKRHYEVFPELPQRWMAVHQRCLAGNVESNPDDQFVRPDGSITYNRWECRPWYWGSGQIGGIVIYSEVTTEQKMAEIAQRKAKAEVEEINRELERKVNERTAKLQETVNDIEQFSYSMTHDLRAPLRAIHGFARFLQEESGNVLSPSGRDYLNRIFKSVERMDHLVEDALNYGRIVMEDASLQKINAADIIRDIILSDDAFQPPLADIALIGDFPPVLGYQAGVVQCASNFLRNAIKFVPPGSIPRVRIWGEAVGDWVQINFEDNGIGIAPEHQERIFGMFQQLDKSFGGTGIGLAIVRKAVKRMGGRVGVQSELGKGSRFWMELKRG